MLFTGGNPLIQKHCILFKVLILIVTFSGCATLVDPVGDGRLADTPELGQGVLYGFTFNGDKAPATRGCKTYFKNMQTEKQYAFSWNFGDNAFFISLPPGEYQSPTVTCGITRYNDKTPPTWFVYKDKISVLAPIEISMVASDDMRYSLMPAKQHRAFMQKVLKQLSDNNQKRLVSGHTGKAITSDMMDEPKIRATVIFYAKKGKPDTAKLIERLDPYIVSCSLKENKKYGLALGNLQYKVSVTPKGTNKVETVVSNSVHSDEYLNCLTNALETWKPNDNATDSFDFYL